MTREGHFIGTESSRCPTVSHILKVEGTAETELPVAEMVLNHGEEEMAHVLRYGHTSRKP